MKTKIVLIALFVAAFMFPSVGTVDTADAFGNYGCWRDNPTQNEHIMCLRTLLRDNAPQHLSSPSNDGLGNWGCSRPTFPAHRDCLRSILDRHAPHVAINSGSNYNHLREPMATGGVNGVEDSSHSCTQFSGAARTSCENAAMQGNHGAGMGNQGGGTYCSPAQRSVNAC
tara:strand:+ start:295 stop:804 length:510 start_codon:yes stop_codon:yes gene_type:complete